MNRKTYGAICGIISMAAVVVFLVWGMIEKTYAHSWIVFVVSGFCCAVLGMVNSIKSEKKDDSPDDGKKE